MQSVLSQGLLNARNMHARSRPSPALEAPSVLTAEGQQAGVGDGRLAQVQHLEHGEVLRQEPQAGVSKLRSTEPLSPGTRPASPRHPGK